MPLSKDIADDARILAGPAALGASPAVENDESVISKNREHYEKQYARYTGAKLVERVRRVDSFLVDAVKTDTSWRGLYHDGFARRLSGARVLELGCGNGLNALIMAALGAGVVANDLSEQSERIMREAATELGLQLDVVVGDFSQIPFDTHSFDFVVGKAFLHHLTHELERSYLSKVAQVLKPTGEARFVEPATNSRMLDALRWLVPVPDRPSKLSAHRFQEWKALDPHPERDNGSAHYRDVGASFFADVDIVPFGSLERFSRLIPGHEFNRRFRRAAFRIEEHLPASVRFAAARSQLIRYRRPKAARINLGSTNDER